MADRFQIRNFSRNGDEIRFTVVALNPDGTIDTNYTGAFTWTLDNMSDPGAGLFEAVDQGQRGYRATILAPDQRTSLSANFPGSSTGATISLSGPNGTSISLPLSGDHVIAGGAGNDAISGNIGSETFLFQQGGDDSVFGGNGNDDFYFGAAYTADDIVSGGNGFDTVGLQGNYSAGVTLGSLSGVEMIALMAGNNTDFRDFAGNFYSYNIVIGADMVVSGNTLAIQANALRVGENLTLDASASAINLRVFGGFGNDHLIGGSGDDGFFFGDDRFGPGDRVDGGAGIDQVALQGSFKGSEALRFGENQLTGVEFLVLLSTSDPRYAGTHWASYDITMHDGNVAAGQQMIISANTLTAPRGERLVFDGSAELDGSFVIYGGAVYDRLIGSQGADQIWGGGDLDYIVGNGGADILYGGEYFPDVFAYRRASDSTPDARDRIMDFESWDAFDLSDLATQVGGSFTFIGNAAPSAARQVQVIQVGNQATLSIFIDDDAIADMMIDVTVLHGYVITKASFDVPLM